MKRLYEPGERFPGYSYKEIIVPSQPVPFKEGLVTAVSPVAGMSCSMQAQYSAAYHSSGLVTEALGIMHDVPKVPLRFQVMGIDRKVEVRIPRDAQYMLKPGEQVVVYAHEFDEKSKQRPAADAYLELSGSPFGLTAIAAGLRTAALPHDPKSDPCDIDFGKTPQEPDPYANLNIISSIKGSSGTKYSKEIFQNPESLELSEDPLGRSRRDSVESLKARLRAGELLGDLESRVPISLLGMQVLDDNGDVRFQLVCQPGLSFE
jgi:hypothetical protein